MKILISEQQVKKVLLELNDTKHMAERLVERCLHEKLSIALVRKIELGHGQTMEHIDKVGYYTFTEMEKNELREKMLQIFSYDYNKKSNFNVNESYNYLKMLKKQINSQFNSWGILFYLFSFHKKFLNLFPPFTLVENRGFDGSGFHKSTSDVFNRVASKETTSTISYPRINKLNNKNLKKIKTFLLHELSLLTKIKNYLFK